MKFWDEQNVLGCSVGEELFLVVYAHYQKLETGNSWNQQKHCIPLSYYHFFPQMMMDVAVSFHFNLCWKFHVSTVKLGRMEASDHVTVIAFTSQHRAAKWRNQRVHLDDWTLIRADKYQHLLLSHFKMYDYRVWPKFYHQVNSRFMDVLVFFLPLPCV